MNLDELQRLAEGATPGPWEADKYGFIHSKRSTVCQFWDKTEEDFADHEVNAEYIAAMHPDTAKKLIAVARAAKAAVFGGAGEYFDALVALRTALEELK